LQNVHRTQPVGADEQVAPFLAAVGASGDDLVVVLLDRCDLRSEAHVPGGGCELALQIGSMDGDRTLEQIPGDLGKLAALPGEDGAPLCRCTLSRDRVSHPEPIERAHRVREQGEARADRVDARRALQHDHLMPAPAHADRRTQSGDPSPGDDHAHARQDTESNHSSNVGPARGPPRRSGSSTRLVRRSSSSP
jgi:hypothetical protein